MKKKILSLLAAFFMLFGTSAMAQVDSTLEGDVNGDGVEDIADITAVIAIIKQNAEANPTYYWYVGQTNPTEMTTITSTVGAQGWRLISEPSKVSQSNPIFDTAFKSTDVVTGTGFANWYIALPVDKSYKIYDSDYADQVAVGNFEKQSATVLFNGINYTVYKGVATPRKFDGYIIY